MIVENAARSGNMCNMTKAEYEKATTMEYEGNKFVYTLVRFIDKLI